MKKEKSQFKSKNGFKFLVVVFSFSILFFNLTPVLADEPGQDNFVYLFHLYYDNGQLFADRDFEFKYDVLPEEFVPETLLTQFPFSGEVVNFKGETAATFQFDPRKGDFNFIKGKILVKAPYVPDGQKAVFYDAQRNPLLTVFVSDSSFCNDDNICDSQRGEDANTCSNDCKSLPTTNNRQPTTDKNGLSGKMITFLAVALILVAVSAWYGWKWWQKRKASRLQTSNQFTDKLG